MKYPLPAPYGKRWPEPAFSAYEDGLAIEQECTSGVRPSKVQVRYDEVDTALLGSVTPDGGECLCDEGVEYVIKNLCRAVHDDACAECRSGEKCHRRRRIDELAIIEPRLSGQQALL